VVYSISADRLPVRGDAQLAAIRHFEMSSGFLALGDSYTIGESVPDDMSWPAQLLRLLIGHGKAIERLQIIAKTGWTTEELDAAIDVASPRGPFDLVSLLIGVNDQYRGRSTDVYRAQFSSLLGRAILLAGGEPSRVVVLSIPDWGVTPFAREKRLDSTVIGREIDAFNTINRHETTRAGARHVDITPISRLASNDPSQLAPDGLHPSVDAYRLWAKLALDPALAALRDP
jgi:lysophospholipase L1-like esterase